jgi:diguanylate cyclase (GGDEF)-like protein
MGLISIRENQSLFSCELYRIFFSHQIFNESSQAEKNIIQLQQENEDLKKLVYIDKLTKVGNRAYFDLSLEKEWKTAVRHGHCLSLILLDIDCFKLYNDTYGHVAGDGCLQKVATAIHNSIKRAEDFAYRYGGEEFAVLLPKTNQIGAVSLAEEIRKKIQNLSIEHINSQVNLKVVTASLGVATIAPKHQDHPNMIILEADRALYLAKTKGRNQVNFSQLSD